MSLNAKKKSNYPRVPEGDHLAVIAQIIDLGSQFKTNYASGEVETYPDGNPKINHEVFITFEFPLVTAEFDGEEKPLWLSKTYTVSLHEKAALVSLLSAAKVKSSDLTELAGKPLQVGVGSTSGNKAKIISTSQAKAKFIHGDDVVTVADVAKLSKGYCTIYDHDDPDQEIFDTFPDFIKEKITNQASKDKYEEQQKSQPEETEEQHSEY
jgi:hypothetical protein